MSFLRVSVAAQSADNLDPDPRNSPVQKYLTQGIDEGPGLGDFQSLGANLVSSDPAVTLANLGDTALQIGEQSVVNAGISTAIQGGSFMAALKNNVINLTLSKT